jgi:hypothetical protein
MENGTKVRARRAARAQIIFLASEKPQGVAGKLHPDGLAEHPVSG